MTTVSEEPISTVKGSHALALQATLCPYTTKAVKNVSPIATYAMQQKHVGNAKSLLNWILMVHAYLARRTLFISR